LGYCGILDQIEPVECMTEGHQISNSKAVVKIQVGSGSCTGFFFGAHNRLLTNHHCIRSFASGSHSAEVILYYQETDCSYQSGFSLMWPLPAGCGCFSSKTEMKIDVRALIATYPEQDASLISLDYTDAQDFEHKVLAYYDDLQAQTSSSPFHTPQVGDHVYIISHPGGGKKVISRKNDNGNFCKITKTYSSGRFRTNCETKSGSSGAPVFLASNGELIGLHNSGGSTNCDTDIEAARTTGGYSMKKIWEKMKDSQFQCCGKFHKTTNYNDADPRRFCDDIPYVWGSFHDDISSIQISPDCKVYAYPDIMMSGSLKSFDGNKGNLGDWNNKISSMRFVRKPEDSDRCWVRFYADQLYGGYTYFFTQDHPIIYNDAWESGDSAFSSFKLLEGCSIKVYKGSKYTGESKLFGSDQSYVGNDFNDQISSFRLIKDSQECWIRLFKSEGCPLSEYNADQTLKYYDDMDELPSNWNDKVKSFRIAEHCMAQAFEHNNFEGENAAFPSWVGSSPYIYEDGTHFYNPSSSGSNWYCVSHLRYKTDKYGNILTMTNKITSFRLFHRNHRPTRRSLEEETEE